jgi:hypothetical protein
MNQSFSEIYHNYTDQYDFREFVSYFKSRGLFLEQPSTGLIIQLSEEGDSIPTSADSISEVINKDKTAAFQLWLDRRTDVCCRIRLLEGCVSQVYYLDGLSLVERESVIEMLRDYFRNLVKAGCALLLIVDRRRYPDNFDWDEFALGMSEITTPEALPDEVVLRLEKLHRIKLDLSGRTERFNEGYVTVRRE